MATTPNHGYWKSLAELRGETDGDGSLPDPRTADDVSDPLSRRNFFHLMGASMALAGVAAPGCKRYDKEEIVPLARRPEDQVPGTTQQFASAFDFCGAAQALLVSSYEGRPIKIDGNPEHPFAGGGVVPGTTRHGGSSAFAQASILSLYDPDRSQSALERGKPSTIDAFKAWLREARAQILSGAARVRVLSEASSSPTLARLKAHFKEQLPGAKWYEWEPLSWDNERSGTRIAFGRPVRPLARLDACETIVSLDCDLFVEHPANVRYNRDFAKSRRPSGGSLGDGRISRLWAIESTFTTSGAAADHRLPLRSELILPIVSAILSVVKTGTMPETPTVLAEPAVSKFVKLMAEELRQNRGRGVVIAGRRQPALVHAIVARINHEIGAVGATLDYLEDPAPERPSHLEDISALAREIEQKQVDTLIILGGNPVYDAPVDLEFGKALAGIATTIHLSEYANETSAAATWHVPRAHYLEAWGDARTWDGTITIAQPIITPLYGGIAAPELLALVLGDDKSGEQLVKDTYDQFGVPVTWRKTVHDGYLPASQLPRAEGLTPSDDGNPTQLAPGQEAGSRGLKNGGLEVTFSPSHSTWDGRYANNAWLQEIPGFVTKICWDNFAMVSPATADELGLENDSLIKIKVGNREMEVACYVMPGQARLSIGVILGGGRTRAGKVGGDGKKKVGFDTYALRATSGMDIASGATVTATGKEYELANVQEHWDIKRGLKKDVGRNTLGGMDDRIPDLVVHATTTELADPEWQAAKETDFFYEKMRNLSLFEENQWENQTHRWGMAIDLGSCTGCNACMVACQSENNIPVVGKRQVFKNREMHWIRIDRYFMGPVDDPEISSQPMLCQQCENAPCEQVCPVNATTHSSEGLNDMAYNRCIGTRYCLNNCPYRVRRFNFFDFRGDVYTDSRAKVRKLLFNPEVTVRERGVMEKCTWCVQRIQNGKIAAKAAGRALVDGDIVTACQAACPTEAIVFGDLADKNSRVSKLHQEKRSYGLLDDLLYTRPRNHYMARIRNPHPLLVAQAEPPKQPAVMPGGGHP